MKYLYVAIDIETTGTDFRDHRICQFGCTIFTDIDILRSTSWDVYVAPEDIAMATEEALSVHGIPARKMLMGMPIENVFLDFEKTVIQELSAKMDRDDKIMAVFHNSPFDVPFIRLATHLPREEFMDRLLRRVLDTVTMGYMKDGRCGNSLSLASLCERFLSTEDLANWQKHTANGDSYMTARLAQALMQ